MEINENELDSVAGGTVVETKEGKFIIMSPHAKEFETREEAEKAEKKPSLSILQSPVIYGHIDPIHKKSEGYPRTGPRGIPRPMPKNK